MLEYRLPFPNPKLASSAERTTTQEDDLVLLAAGKPPWAEANDEAKIKARGQKVMLQRLYLVKYSPSQAHTPCHIQKTTIPLT